MTLEEPDWADDAEQRVLTAAIPLAASLGWNANLVIRAGAAAGLSQGETELLLPNGARDLAALLSRRHDRLAMRALAEVDPTALKMRERIRQAVAARLDATAGDGEATKRWATFLALPTNAPLGLRLAWESADLLWRWAGDTATDENHYSKRAILSEILITTLAIRLSGGENAALAHLDGRIGAVMAFEKWKAGVKPLDGARRVVSALGRLRYGRAA
jgi:ubiquinone biosynthesis protein COQ9